MPRLGSDIQKEIGRGLTVTDGNKYQWSELSDIDIDTLEATAIYRRKDGMIAISYEEDGPELVTVKIKLKPPVYIGINIPRPKWAGKPTSDAIREWNRGAFRITWEGGG